MSGGSLGLGLQTGSYGSLQQYQQLQNNIMLPNQLLSPSPLTPPFLNRKQAKMLKEKEKLYYWVYKAFGRKNSGMMFLAVVSTVVFVWTVFAGKGFDLPAYSPVYSLTYVNEKQSSKTEFRGSEFGGYPSLKDREDSYNIRESMNVHCGFVEGPRPGHGTGFDIEDADFKEMEQCKG